MSDAQSQSPDLSTRIIRLFGSSRLTIVVLAAIAVLSFLGVTGRWGFEDVYHTRYFRFLMGILFTNMLVCTIDRLPSSIRRIRMDLGPIAPPPPREPDHVITVESDDMKDVLDRAEQIAFGKSGGFPRREIELRAKSAGGEGEGAQAGEKRLASFRSAGNVSLLGPHVTHLGILVTIVGGIVGSVWTLNGSLWLKPGEQSSMVSVGRPGIEIKQDLGFSIRCNDFNITTYQDSEMPSDYLCDLTIIDQGGEVANKVIEVNSPLYYKGYGIFQSSYRREPVVRLVARSLEDGSTVGREVSRGEAFVPPGSGSTYFLMNYEPHAIGMGRDLGPKAEIARFEGSSPVESLKLFENFPDFDKGRDDTYQLSFKTVSSVLSTGLQVIRDPGLPVVWTGFALLTIGVMISFFIFHRRVWLVARPSEGKIELWLIGRTRKAEGMFKRQIEEMAERLIRGLGGKPVG